MGIASNDVSHWSKYATRGAIINSVKRCEAVVIRLKQEIATLKEEGQESARINNHNVEVSSQQIATLTILKESYRDEGIRLAERITALTAENKRLREALEKLLNLFEPFDIFGRIETEMLRIIQEALRGGEVK